MNDLYRINDDRPSDSFKKKTFSGFKKNEIINAVLKSLKTSCKILSWKGKKPIRNLQSIARKNRYALLERQCNKDKVKTVLLGHHIDDMYENFFIRLF